MTPAELDALQGHTPGPWAVHRHNASVVPLAHVSRPIGGHGDAKRDIADYAQEICLLHWPDRHRNEDEVRANARLCAAAPALLHYVDDLRANHKDLMEQLATAQSQEVCTVAHSAEVMEFCPYCKIERLRAKLAEWAGECAECGGSGRMTVHALIGGLPLREEPCPACSDIRALL